MATDERLFYATLASHVLQNSQLRDLNQKLGAVASEMAAEKSTASWEDTLREIVFEAENRLRSYQKTAREDPRAAIAWVRRNLLEFQDLDLTSKSFRAYNDKAHLRLTVESHERLIRECAAELTPQEQHQAERCGKYLLERHQLRRLIELLEKQQLVALANSELSAMEERTAPVTVVVVVGGLCIPVGFLWALWSMLDWLVEKNSIGPMPFGGLSLLVIGSILHFAGQASSPWKAIEKQRTRVAKLEVQHRVDPTEVSRLQRMIGAKSLPELLAMQNEGEALILDVLGDGAYHLESEQSLMS